MLQRFPVGFQHPSIPAVNDQHGGLTHLRQDFVAKREMAAPQDQSLHRIRLRGRHPKRRRRHAPRAAPPARGLATPPSPESRESSGGVDPSAAAGRSGIPPSSGRTAPRPESAFPGARWPDLRRSAHAPRTDGAPGIAHFPRHRRRGRARPPVPAGSGCRSIRHSLPGSSNSGVSSQTFLQTGYTNCSSAATSHQAARGRASTSSSLTGDPSR